MIDILTEGTKAQGNDNCQQVITAENFESDDLEIKTETSQANPKKYYSRVKDSSVKATFDFDYTGEAKLVAYLGNPNRINDTSKKIAESIEVSIDGDFFEQDEVSYADAGFGQGDGRTYYSAIMLGTIDVYPYSMEVVIEGNDSDLNIGAISVIPTEPVSPEEAPVNPDKPSKGCGGSIIATTSIIALLAVAGGSLLVFRKRKED